MMSDTVVIHAAESPVSTPASAGGPGKTSRQTGHPAPGQRQNQSLVQELARRRLPRDFLARPATAVAPDLIGQYLVLVRNNSLRIGRIVEAEAYQGPEDLAAHSAGGRRTARTEVMFGPPGHAYVYLIYGIWNCLNVVTATVGAPHAVLIRALEPGAGIEGGTHGPGLLCRTLGIDRQDNGRDLCAAESPLWLAAAPPDAPPPRIVASPRVGVDYAGPWAGKPWRFHDADSPYVSTARRKHLK